MNVTRAGEPEDASDARDVEPLLRRTLSDHGQPPADLPDLNDAIRARLTGRSRGRWVPLAAAAAVVALVAAVLAVTQLGHGSTVAGPSPAVPTTSNSTGPGSSDPGLVLDAVAATKPYRSAPANYPTVPFDGPNPPPPCNPASVSMKLVDVRHGPARPQGETDSPTSFTVIGTAISKQSCTFDAVGLPANAVDASGKVVSQDAMFPAIGLPSVRVDPGSVVVLEGEWPYFCGHSPGSLTLSIPAPQRAGTGTSAPWKLDANIPAPGRSTSCGPISAGGGPSLKVISVGEPGSIATLDPRLQMPTAAAAGSAVPARLLLTNHTTTRVPMRGCPDLAVQIAGTDVASLPAGNQVVIRPGCRDDLVLLPGESLSVEIPLDIPSAKASMNATVWLDWYRPATAPSDSWASFVWTSFDLTVGGHTTSPPAASTTTVSTTTVSTTETSNTEAPTTETLTTEAGISRIRAVPAVAPYRAVQPNVRSNSNVPPCTAKTMTMAVVPPSVVGRADAGSTTHVTIVGTPHAPEGQDPNTFRCSVSQEYGGAELRNSAGHLMAENKPQRGTFDLRRPLVLSAGEQLVFSANWSVNCRTGLEVASIVVTLDKNISLPVAGGLTFVHCDAQNQAEIDEVGIAENIASSSLLDTLVPTLDFPTGIHGGAAVGGVIRFVNPSDLTVAVAQCSDIELDLSTARGDLVRTDMLRPVCPHVLSVPPHASVEVQVQWTAPAAGSYRLSARWCGARLTTSDVPVTVTP